MGWRFPKRKPRAENVMDYRDFQEATQPFVEELGSLDESNFSDSLKTQLTTSDMAVDVHRRATSASVECNDDIRDPTDPDYSVSDIQKITDREAWVPLEGLDIEFTSRGGIVDVSASVQCWRPDEETGTFPPATLSPPPDAYPSGGGNNPVDPGTGVHRDYVFSNMYFQFAFELDGTVVSETVWGDLDARSSVSMEYGTGGFVFPVHIEAVLKVISGYHRLRVVAKLINGPNKHYWRYDDINASDKQVYRRGSLYVGSREFIVVEDS
jgi:hypothetical protein